MSSDWGRTDSGEGARGEVLVNTETAGHGELEAGVSAPLLEVGGILIQKKDIKS